MASSGHWAQDEIPARGNRDGVLDDPGNGSAAFDGCDIVGITRMDVPERPAEQPAVEFLGVAQIWCDEIRPNYLADVMFVTGRGIEGRKFEGCGVQR
jgi:hypothetical protein